MGTMLIELSAISQPDIWLNLCALSCFGGFVLWVTFGGDTGSGGARRWRLANLAALPAILSGRCFPAPAACSRSVIPN